MLVPFVNEEGDRGTSGPSGQADSPVPHRGLLTRPENQAPHCILLSKLELGEGTCATPIR